MALRVLFLFFLFAISNAQVNQVTQIPQIPEIPEIPKPYDLVFPTVGSMAAAILRDVPFESDTTEFTVCCRINQIRPTATYFSYATREESNSIVLEASKSTTEVWVDNYMMEFKTDQRALNKFVHYCYSWGSSDGNVKIYKEGQLVEAKTFANSKGRKLGGKGVFVLGQDQDRLGGGFDSDTSLTGRITDVEVWNRVLTDAEVASAHFNVISGNIVSWACLKDRWELTKVTVADSEMKFEGISVPTNTKLAASVTCLTTSTPGLPLDQVTTSIPKLPLDQVTTSTPKLPKDSPKTKI